MGGIASSPAEYAIDILCDVSGFTSVLDEDDTTAQLSLNSIDTWGGGVNTSINNIETDLNGFPDELKNLTTDEIKQYENMGDNTVSYEQWGYLGSMLGQPLETLGGHDVIELDDVSNVGSGKIVTDTERSNWNTAYGWGDHSGLYDLLGAATSAVSSHESTYNHTHYNTAYGWGDHGVAGYLKVDGSVALSGAWDMGGQIISNLLIGTTGTDGEGGLRWDGTEGLQQYLSSAWATIGGGGGGGGDFLADGSIPMTGTLDLDGNPVDNVSYIVGNATYLKIGADGATGHGLSTESDLLVRGKLEVDGAFYMDSSGFFYSSVKHLSDLQMYDNTWFTFGTGWDSILQWNISQASHTVVFGLGNTSKSIIYTKKVNVAKNHDHGNQANPTIFVHSLTNPDTANDEWWSITHDVTNAVYNIGSGVHSFTGGNMVLENGRTFSTYESWNCLGATGENQIVFPDNLPDALTFGESTNPYLRFVTTNTAEEVQVSGGNVGTHYTKFEADGTLVFVGDATVWEDLNFSIGQLRTGGTRPGFVNKRTTGIYQDSFDVGEEVSGSVEIPHAAKISSTMTPHIHWTSDAGDTTGNFRFEITYKITAEGAEWTSAVTVINTGDIAISQQWENTRADFTSTIANLNAVGAQLELTIKRVAADTDEWAGEIFISTWGLHHEKDMDGSRTITVK